MNLAKVTTNVIDSDFFFDNRFKIDPNPYWQVIITLGKIKNERSFSEKNYDPDN